MELMLLIDLSFIRTRLLSLYLYAIQVYALRSLGGSKSSSLVHLSVILSISPRVLYIFFNIEMSWED